MTAPPAREQSDPPSPTDRRPPRRGGGSSPSPCTCASAAGRAAGLARALAAAALLALSGALALPATAQAEVLVSNIGQGNTDSHTGASARSQRFTIGSSATASTYTLTGVDVVSAGTRDFTAQVCGVDSNDHPTSTCTDLMPPGTFAAGTMSFTAPENATLDKGETYAVVLTPVGSFIDYGRTTSEAEDLGKQPGWTIANEFEYLSGFSNTWAETPGYSVRIAIKGAVVEGVPAVTGTAVTSSPAASGNYETGEVIQVTVTFSEAVTVDTASGTPRLALTIGSNTRYADYSASDSTSTALVFAYPVVAADQDNDGISIDADALELNGGAIHKEGDASTDALLNQGALSTQSGHRVNQADASIVSNGVSVISTPQAATDTYSAGEVIEIQVEFNTAVNATTGTDFVLSVAGAKRAPLLRGNGTDTLVFGYTVQAADSDGNGIWIGPQDRTLVGNRNGTPQNGAITSVATGRAADLTHAELGTLSGHKVDGSLTPTASTDATLSGGTVTAGSTTLVTFASGTATYTASVANGVEEVTFAPTKHAEATVRYLKGTDVLTDADGTDDGFQVALAVGANAITVEVTAEDGTTTQDYTVTVTRAAGASTPVWSTTMLVASTAGRNRYGYSAANSTGSLADGDFDYGSVTYTVSSLEVTTGEVGFTVDRNGLPTTDTLTLELGGHVFPFSERTSTSTRQWIWTSPTALRPPATEFPVGATVTACLRTATQTCPTGRIDLPMVSTDATLSALSLGTGVTLSPTFASDTYAYTASVANSVEEVTFAPTKHAEATVRYLKGTDVLTDADGTDDGFQVALAVGANAITVEVTAEDGTTTQDYTVTVTRAAGASTPVWSTTLTVGRSGAAFGYDDGEGTLGDDDFEYGSVTYTVTKLYVTTADVVFRVDKGGLPTVDTLTLELGAHELPFSARYNTEGTVVWYWNVPDELDDPPTEFPVGTTATACLRTATQTCPAGRIDLPTTLPTLSIADAEGDEDVGVEFTATLTTAVSAKVTATWTASIESGDTASAADLATTKSGEVEFDADATTAKFTVPVNNDTTDEPDQTFTVTLSGVSTNAQLAADPTAEGTIDDDDPAPTLTVADLRHDEDDSTASVTVSLSELSEKRVRFKLRGVEDRAGDTASFGVDWSQRPSFETAFFPINAGTMSVLRFAVGIVGDTLDEDDETLTVEAFSLQNAQGSASDREATITIVDDDPTPTVTVAAASATEGDKVEFVVTLSAVSGRDVEVGYATSVETGDTAVSDTDFTAATGTLTILASDSTDAGTVEVQTTEDDASESAETFTLTLSATKNVALGTPSTATGTINNRTTAPTITDVAVTSTPVLETDTYGTGEEILFTVTFSGRVDVTGDPEFAFSLDTGEDRAPYKSGSGTAALVFAYTVAPGEEGDDGIFLLDGSDFNNRVGAVTLDSDDAIKAAGSTTDADLAHTGRGTESGHKVDGSRSIVSVEVTSTPQLETDTYGATETIQFTVTFNVAVDVTGDPVFRFALGDSGETPREVDAAHDGSTGSTTLVFAYTVVSSDSDDNGIFLRDGTRLDDPDGPVRLDSDDEIKFKDTSTDVPLLWEGRGTQSGHKVDGSRTTGNVAPSFTSSAAFDAAENQTAVGTVAATDSDADDSVTGYAIAGGADMALFEIGATSGELTFKSAPNFEDPQDTGTDNVHEVTVRATSGAGTRVMTADQTIAVTVTNVTEGQSGTVTIDDTTPMVGDELTASTDDAADPDGLPDPFAPTWKWYRTPDGGSETEISGAASATYTVAAADLGATLTAKASWTDTGGFANTLSSAATSAVAAASALPMLSVGNASATEGSSVSFPLTLTAAASENVTVSCTASFESGDTAAAADLSTTSSTATIQIGSTSGSCAISSAQDTIDEEDETFTVTLSNVSSNAQLATDPTAKGTIVDDDTAPTITDVSVTSAPVLGTDTYGAGETIEVSVTFSEAVTATSDTDFVLSVAGAKRAPLLRGSGTATLVFGYTVAPGDADDNGIWIGDQDRTLVGDRNGEPQAGAITSTATGTAADLTHGELGTDSAHKVDGTRSIVSVEVTSTPLLETDTYGATETIQFTVTFNTEVDVDGDPVLKFVLGNSGDVREVDAAYESGGGGTALVFGYTVVSTDEDNNGIYLRDEQDYDDPDGPVRLDSNDEIEFKDTSIDVPLYWAGRGNHPNHKVDGSRTTGNNPPSFTSSPAFDAAENQTAVGTVAATDSDSDDSVTGYAITGGADMALFEIGATSGELTFKSAPNFEDPQDSDTNNTYVVEVTATSGTGTRVMTADQTITVTVTDADEQSAKPDKPELEAVSSSSTSLTATWETPDKNGGPAITGYKLEYKLSTETSWTAFAHTGTAVTTTITGLTADTSYQARVRAENGETDSDWSDASDAVSTNAETVTPTCTLNPGDLWCGVVTVALHSVGGIEGGYGFADASTSTNTSDAGALSDETFTVGTSNYTIDEVRTGTTAGGNAGRLYFGLTGALSDTDKEKLVLHVGSRTFALSDSSAPDSLFTYRWSMTSLDWSSETSVTLRLREANTAPVFADDLAAYTLPENSAVGTSVGAAVTATDADDDTLAYSLEGTDAASFDIDSGTGQIETKSGVTYDFEATQNTYEMTVKADDGNGGTDTIEVNIALLDADEKSDTPAKPVLARVTDSSTSLTATWEKPGLNGGPDITGYDLQYRAAPAGTWMDFEHSDTAVTTTITGLTADTSYQARVLAKNGETDSDWSDTSDAVSTNAETADPMCTLDTAAGDIWCGVLTVGAVSSSSTVSTEVQKPISSKIMNLCIDRSILI